MGGGVRAGRPGGLRLPELEVMLELETRGLEHIELVRRELHAHGYHPIADDGG